MIKFFVALALIGLWSVGCDGDDIAGTEEILDATIPPIPVPTGPQPMTLARTDTGGVVMQAPTPRPLRLTMVGLFRRTLITDPDEPCDTEIDLNCRNVLYGDERQQFDEWLELTGGTRGPCEVRVDILERIDAGRVVDRVTEECLTFINFDLVTPVEIRHVRYWVNVGSRVLGPGTDYSITLKWTEGVLISNGFEFNSTQGFTSTSEATWENCVTETFRAQVSASLEIPEVGGLGAEAEGTFSEEDCYGGREARETSSTLSETFNESRTVTREESVEETTSVTGAEGANRVYTVWQLVDRYIYVNPDGTEIDPVVLRQDDRGWTEGVGATAFPLLSEDEFDARLCRLPEFEVYPGGCSDNGGVRNFFFMDGTPRASASWTPIAISWPEQGNLDHRTQIFYQQTTDFPISGGASTSTVSRW